MEVVGILKFVWKGSMMKKRVMHYGLGKTFVRMKFKELPKDIQQGLIDRYINRNDKLQITKNTVNIVFACEDIFAYDT